MNGPMYTQDQFLVIAGQLAVVRTAGTSGRDRQPGPDVSRHTTRSAPAATATAPPSITRSPTPTPAGPAADRQREPAHRRAKHGSCCHGDDDAHGRTGEQHGRRQLPVPTATNCNPDRTSDLTQKPIIYAQNDAGLPHQLQPRRTSPIPRTLNGTGKNDYYGPCGDIYVYGTYSTPLTLAAANDVDRHRQPVNAHRHQPDRNDEPDGDGDAGPGRQPVRPRRCTQLAPAQPECHDRRRHPHARTLVLRRQLQCGGDRHRGR